MKKKKRSFFDHVQTYIFRGCLAAIPLLLCYLIIKILYEMIDKKVMNVFENLFGFRIPGLGIVLVLIILYLLGLVASNVVGNRFLALIENFTSRIPILKSIYQIGKQVALAMSTQEKQVFQKVLLTDCFKKGDWLVAFVTGTMHDEKTGEKLFKLFIPAAIGMPTVGFLIFVRESQTIDPNWTIDEGMRTVISGGIIGPDIIRGIKKEKIEDVETT